MSNEPIPMDATAAAAQRDAANHDNVVRTALLASAAMTVACAGVMSGAWGYPYPRAIFLRATSCSLIASLFFLTYTVWRGFSVTERWKRLRHIFLRGMLLIAMFYGATAMFYLMRASTCISDALCNVTASELTPEQVAEIARRIWF